MRKIDSSSFVAVLGVISSVAGTVFFLSEHLAANAQLTLSLIALLASVIAGLVTGLYSKEVAQVAKKLERKRRVFISYPHDSLDAAQQIVSVLRRSGVKVWVDTEQVRPGEEIRTRINQALEQSDVAVIILHGKPSAFSRYEIRAAMDRGIPVIPVVVGSAEIPSKLQGLRYINFRDTEQGSQELVEALP